MDQQPIRSKTNLVPITKINSVRNASGHRCMPIEDINTIFRVDESPLLMLF